MKIQPAWMMAAFLFSACAQDQEPVISTDAISVHTVQRGDMPLRIRAAGSIVSLRPPRAVVKLSDPGVGPCKVGQKITAQIAPPKLLTGQVVRIPDPDSGRCEIEFSEPLPDAAAVGAKLEALIDIGHQMRDVVFFGRLADSSPNSEATVFVLEPGGQYARRTSVHYGQISGPLIQIVSGLSPGDRVIVTDMSKWMSSPRVRLQ
jgi:HlyD family secretion protein